MKFRTIALGGATATVATIVLWRRRRRSGMPSPSPVELGLSDGTSADLGPDDPAVPDLMELAAGVRRHLAIGT
jgi:hypothetical protein